MKSTTGRSRLFLAALAALLLAPTVKAQPAAANSAPVTPAKVDPAVSKEIETVLGRLRAYYLLPDYPDAESVMKSQKEDGSWADVDYDNKDAAWAPAKHIERVKEMAAAYAKTGNPYYHSAKMLEGAEKGLTFWYARKPRSNNWWSNDIGQQLQLERILVLLEHDLPPELLQTGMTYFKDLSKPSTATGENLVWFAGEYLTHGLLAKNEAEISGAVKVIEDTIVITDKEGIQVDYSFHQHGAQLYNGGYGYGLLQDSSMYAAYVAGTRFAFSKEKIDLLSAYCLDGCRWMMRGPMFDYSANGRGLVRPASKKPVPAYARRDEYCDQLAELNPAHKAEFEALLASMRGTGEACTVTGNRQFWRSDFMVQQTKELYFSIKMNSARTNGTEVINGENLKGYWLPYGVTYIAPTGKEYAGIFAVWDWAHLPGVTSPTVELKPVNGFKQPNDFVGGVSDGTNGACAMKLDLDLVHAHKAWFCYGDSVVALGSGISSASDQPVDTTINQTLLKGPVVVDGKKVEEGKHELKGVSRVMHDNICYYFPEKTDVTVGNQVQNGSYHSISSSILEAPVSEKVFSLWVHHGVKPTDGKYAYSVEADTDKKTMSFVILSNTTDVQAVAFSPDTTQAIFYSPGKIEIKSGLTLQVDEPCMVQVKSDKKDITVALSSPMSGKTVNVTLNGKQIPFELPSGSMEGSTQIKDAGSPKL